jgi:uncharacterized protein
MVTQSTALKIAQDYLHEVRALGVGVRKAILFGSFAKNCQHEWSDIDVALFADDFVGLTALDKEYFRSLHLLPKFMSVEVHTSPLSRYEAGDPFVDEVKKTGIEIN